VGDSGYGIDTAFSQIGTAASDVIRSRYWDPYLDVASRVLPKDLRSLWNMSLYYAITHPVIAPLIQKKSTYVVTRPVYETTDSETRLRYTEVMERVLKVRGFLAAFNMDYNTFGNAYASVGFPFVKLLKCKKCGHVVRADQVEYALENLEFLLPRCPKCFQRARAEVKDKYYRTTRGMRLIRWNPQHITVEEDHAGRCTYYLRPPATLENALRITRRSIINQTPQELIDAIREKKDLKFDDGDRMPGGAVFCSKRLGPSNQTYRGYGVPLGMAAQKDAFLMQIMRKAQESIMFEHIVPMRFAFPANAMDLAQAIDLSDLQQNIAMQMREWRRDQNRVIVFPVQVVLDELGGKGRALLLNPEIRQQAELICVAMGFPPEFLMGGVSYSGSNVSLRIVENDFLFNFADNEDLLQYIANQVAWFMGWPTVQLRQKPFKMADDLQRAAFDASLVAQNMLSKSTMLQSRDYDPEGEASQIKKEIPIYGELIQQQAILQARAQGAANLIASQYNVQVAKIQGQMQPGGMPVPSAVQPGMGGEEEGEQPVSAEQAVASYESPLAQGVMGMVPTEYANFLYNQLSTLPPLQQTQAMQNIRQQMPGVASAVAELLANKGMSDAAGGRPLPDRLPPRRDPSKSLI